MSVREDPSPHTFLNIFIFFCLFSPAIFLPHLAFNSMLRQMYKSPVDACLMQSMIEDWRKKWSGSHNMTFIQAQLAAYAGPSDALPRLRQSQLYAMLNTPNVSAAAEGEKQYVSDLEQTHAP